MRFSALGLIAAISALALGAPAFAQVYPTQNPGYTPSAILAPTACSAACDVTFLTNNVGTVDVRVSGSGTGIAATVQGTTERGTSPTYTNLVAEGIGSPSGGAITSTGLWRVNTTGLASVRVHLTAVTGSITVSMSGTPATGIVQQSPLRRTTYSAAFTALAPAASATDFLTLTGSASATVRLTEVSCSGISTAAATATVNGVIRSTANTGGTSSAGTAVPHDSASAAASATVLGYTANPTTGTLVGSIRSSKLATNTAATSAFAADRLVWRFGTDQEQPVVLRGIAQVFALNGAGASFTTGAVLNCAVTWTEE